LRIPPVAHHLGKRAGAAGTDELTELRIAVRS
jgi:hypothetical protein